jgi:heat shock protein HspQ
VSHAREHFVIAVDKSVVKYGGRSRPIYVCVAAVDAETRHPMLFEASLTDEDHGQPPRFPQRLRRMCLR